MKIDENSPLYRNMVSLKEEIDGQKSVVDLSSLVHGFSNLIFSKREITSLADIETQIALADDLEQLRSMHAMMEGVVQAGALYFKKNEEMEKILPYAELVPKIADRIEELEKLFPKKERCTASLETQQLQEAVEEAFSGAESFQSAKAGESSGLGRAALQQALNDKAETSTGFQTDVLQEGRTKLHVEFAGKDMPSSASKGEAIEREIEELTTHPKARAALKYILSQEVLDEGPVRITMGLAGGDVGFDAVTIGSVQLNFVQFLKGSDTIHVHIRNFLSATGSKEAKKHTIPFETTVDFDFSITQRGEYEVRNYQTEVFFPKR